MTFKRCIQDKNQEFMPGLGEHCKAIQLAGGTLPEVCMDTIDYIDCPNSSN